MLTTRRRTRRLVPLAAVGAMLLTAAGVAPVASAADNVTIDLVGINDFHGRLESDPYGVPGAAVVAGAVDTFRAANPNTLFVSAGDNVGASTFTSFIQHDDPTLAALNAAGLAVSALGNHEFDQGRVDVDDHLVPGAAFPYLAANLIDTTTGQPAYPTYDIETVDGIRVGFIGAVTEQLPELVSPAGISTLTVAPIVSSVNAVADALSDGDESNGEADVDRAPRARGPGIARPGRLHRRLGLRHDRLRRRRQRRRDLLRAHPPGVRPPDPGERVAGRPDPSGGPVRLVRVPTSTTSSSWWTPPPERRVELLRGRPARDRAAWRALPGRPDGRCRSSPTPSPRPRAPATCPSAPSRPTCVGPCSPTARRTAGASRRSATSSPTSSCGPVSPPVRSSPS